MHDPTSTAGNVPDSETAEAEPAEEEQDVRSAPPQPVPHEEGVEEVEGGEGQGVEETISEVAAASSSTSERPAPTQHTLASAMDTIVNMLQNANKTYENAKHTLALEPLPFEKRRSLWRSTAHVEKTVLENRGLFWLLADAEVVNFETLDFIKTDIRSLMSNQPSLSDINDIEGSLTAILKAYAQYRPSLSYTQGVSSLVALLLRYVPDPEEAFWMFTTLLEEYGVGCFYDHACFRGIVEAFAACLPHAVGRHIQSIPLHMAEYLRAWLGSLFSHSFHSEVAEVVLDLMWSSERRSFIPIRVASSLHAFFKADILACNSIADATLYFQTGLPNKVTVDILRRALSLGDWFYLRNPLPLQMMDAIAKAPKFDSTRSRKLATQLTREYDLPTGEASAKVTTAVTKVWSFAKTWVSSQVQSSSSVTSSGEKDDGRQKCPYHMYPCHCVPTTPTTK